MRIKVSVIIPVWNPGAGISRCIESLQNQTLKDIEMIFVDDCGSDDSMDKVHMAASEDPRIRILKNEKNIGPGASRNVGVEAALGEYLSFVDPDDYVAPDFLEILYTEASRESLDIVKGSVIYEKKDGSEPDNKKRNQSIREGVAAGKPLYLLFINEHISAIYRHQFISSSKVTYGNTRRGEDSTFLLQACSQANTFSLIDSAQYHCCERSDSATNKRDAVMLREMIQSVHEQVDYLLLYLAEDYRIKEWVRNRHAYTLRFIDSFRNYSSIMTCPPKSRVATHMIYSTDRRDTLWQIGIQERLESKLQRRQLFLKMMVWKEWLRESTDYFHQR